MRRALVTGATGLVGSHIAERLAAEGWQVRALTRCGAGDLPAPEIERVVGDVLDTEAFTRAASERDVVFHTAAAITTPGGWETFRRLNIDGTKNAIAAARRSGARLVQLSSVAVYGPEGRYRGAGLETDESTPFGPLPERAYYARSKRESEQLVLAAHERGELWATAVRPTVIYGRRDRQFIPRIGKLVRRGIAPLIGGGRSTLAIVHAANVAQGAILAAQCDAAGGRAYNLANDGDVSVRRFFELAAAGLGRPIRLVPVPVWVARGAFGAARFAAKHLSGGRLNVVSNATLAMFTAGNPFTSARARRELGWTPSVRPEDGIPDALRWWAEHESRRYNKGAT